MKIAEQVKEFFHHEGIHSTTIQPEFVEIEGYNLSDGTSSMNMSGSDCCALDCPTTEEGCAKATCCQTNNKVINYTFLIFKYFYMGFCFTESSTFSHKFSLYVPSKKFHAKC